MVCQNDESLALTMTSMRLPAVGPPLPPPPPFAPAEVARPATTPTTTASSAITATRERENFMRLIGSCLPLSPAPFAGRRRFPARRAGVEVETFRLTVSCKLQEHNH